jgi:exosome complex component RRP42
MFDDDWAASTFLFSRESDRSRPAITLLVIAVGDSIIFDPSRDELAVAESALAVSVAESRRGDGVKAEAMDVDGSIGRELRLLAVRMVDPPSRLTAPGVPSDPPAETSKQGLQSKGAVDGVWKAPLGGTKFAVLDLIIEAVLAKGGVADEVLDGLEGVELA